MERKFKLAKGHEQFTKEFKTVDIEETDVRTVQLTFRSVLQQRENLQKRLAEIDGIIVEMEKYLA